MRPLMSIMLAAFGASHATHHHTHAVNPPFMDNVVNLAAQQLLQKTC
jgi:hypothetical protein